jgi:hypothetical protein
VVGEGSRTSSEYPATSYERCLLHVRLRAEPPHPGEDAPLRGTSLPGLDLGSASRCTPARRLERCSELLGGLHHSLFRLLDHRGGLLDLLLRDLLLLLEVRRDGRAPELLVRTDHASQVLTQDPEVLFQDGRSRVLGEVLGPPTRRSRSPPELLGHLPEGRRLGCLLFPDSLELRLGSVPADPQLACSFCRTLLLQGVDRVVGPLEPRPLLDLCRRERLGTVGRQTLPLLGDLLGLGLDRLFRDPQRLPGLLRSEARDRSSFLRGRTLLDQGLE